MGIIKKARDRAKLAKVSVSLPFGLGSAEWSADASERNAAWSLYVELVTRVAVQPLAVDAGSVREALSSLYSLFGTTREILRTAGPGVGVGKPSVGRIAIDVLNDGLRPFLTKWHVLLRDWESKKPADRSTIEHEADWSEVSDCRAELKELRTQLSTYAQALGQIAELK